MKSELENPITEQKYTPHLFIKAVSYRISLPVTKIIVYADNTSYPLCPRCDSAIEREYVFFCDQCGQKLNWDLFEYARVVRPGSKRK